MRIPTSEEIRNWEVAVSDVPELSFNFPSVKYYKISARFYQQSTGLSPKEYTYYITEGKAQEIIKDIDEWIKFCNDCRYTYPTLSGDTRRRILSCPTYTLTGYSNFIVITSIEAFDHVVDKQYKIIPNGDIHRKMLKSSDIVDTYYTAMEDFKIHLHGIGNSQVFSIKDCKVDTYIGFNKKDKKLDNTERKDNMFENIFKNVKFGKVRGDSIKMSIYGPAFETMDGYVAYNSEKKEYVDVDGLTFDFDNLCYQMPVALKDVKENDFILHNDSWVRVIKVKNGGKIEVEKILAKEVVTILPTKNIFGFDFYTKLISFGTELFGANAATSENPFGNIMLPMLMSENSNNSSSNDFMNMWLLMNMQSQFSGKSEESSGNTSLPFDLNNPLFLMMMFKK